MDIKICEKKQNCGHFLIEKLVQELGGLGNEDGLKKIKSGKQFRAYNRKIKSLERLVREFEFEATAYFNIKGFYPCFDPMQICWGRRKYQACLKNLDKKAYSKNIRSSPSFRVAKAKMEKKKSSLTPPFASLGYLKTKMEVKNEEGI